LIEGFTREQFLRKLVLKSGALALLLQVAFRTTQASIRVIALQSVLALAKSARVKSIILGKAETSATEHTPVIDLVWCLMAAPGATADLPVSEANRDPRCKLMAARCLAQLSWGEESGSAMALMPELVKGLVQVLIRLILALRALRFI
jgi:hypothetical protein